MAKKKIEKFIFKPGISYLSNTFPNAYSLIQSNYRFIQAELTAYLNQEIVDATKCERDIGYIIDGVGWDVALGTNYNAVFLGLTEYNSLDISPTVIRTIQRARNEMLAIGDVQADENAINSVNGSIDEILDIGSNGRAAADTIVYPSPGNITANKENAKNRLIANRNWFAAEVNAWVDAEYPAHDHDVAKCARDVKYAIDSLVYDLTYGGNSATYDNAKFFFYFDASNNPGIDPTHKSQTVAAYDYLASIIVDTVQGLLVVNSAGNTEVQDLSGDSATVVEATILEDLLQIIEDVVNGGATELDNYTRSLPSLIGGDTGRVAARNSINSAKATIIANSVAFSGYTYNLAKCERDLGYVLDAYLYDLRYGGNAKTRKVVSKYWDGGVAQVDGNRLPELDGHAFVRELITDYIIKNIPYDNKQSLVQQVYNNSVTEEITAYTPTNVVYTPSTGLMVITIGAHNLQVGEKVLVQEKSLSFTCAKDNDATLHYYPRAAGVPNVTKRDPFYNKGCPIVSVGATTITLNVGISSNTSVHTFAGATSGAIITGARATLTDLAQITLDVIGFGTEYLPTLVQSGVGTVKFQGRYNTSDLLLITNTISNDVIYSFNDPTRGGHVTVEELADEDFPKFLQTTDAVTTIELNFDTTGHSSTDDLQIFVEKTENGESVTITRPYAFGTDAIERMRIATPMSMLDADFEYGLQPTKWSAIATMRGYPSIYEVPGTETEVVSVITDASVGTEGIGASLITVTTVGAHGWEPGTPITIKGLETGIVGSGRSEGAFVVVTVPAPNKITFYAKGKVGSEGDDLVTSFTQLRQAGFYTGASIGLPSFDILSNGSAGVLTAALDVQDGDDTIPFNGDRPEPGAPLVGVNIPTGSQVTSVIGDGGVVVTPTTAADTAGGSTTITVQDASGIDVGLVIDRGDGFGVSVTNIVGNDVSFSGPLTRDFIGNFVTYNNVTGSNSTSQGGGALFDISRASGVYTVDAIADPGQNYQVDDVIIIPGIDLGGASPANDLEITVATVETDGSILSVTSAGAAFDGNAIINNVTGTYNNGQGSGGTFDVAFANNVFTQVDILDPSYLNVQSTSSGGGGFGAQWDVTTTDNVYTVDKDPAPATGYAPSDIIVIPGTQFEGGLSPTNDLSIEVLTVDVDGSPVTWNIYGVGPDVVESFISPTFQNSGAGIGAVFNVDKNGSTYSVNFTITGSGFAPGDLLTVSGNDLNGAAPDNNLTIEILTVDTGGEILTWSETGTGTNTKFFASKIGNNIIGSGATFDVSINNTVYTVDISAIGSNYAAGQTVTIDGTLVGGLSGTNDISITIDTVTLNDPAGVLGSIDTFTATGSGPFSTIGYKIGDRIRISGTTFPGGSQGTNDLILEITGVGNPDGNITSFDIIGTAPDASVTYNSPPSVTSGSGVDASFNITRLGTVYTATIQAPGSNYLPGDIIVFDGADLGGATPANNLTITVNTVDTGGEI